MSRLTIIKWDVVAPCHTPFWIFHIFGNPFMAPCSGWERFFILTVFQKPLVVVFLSLSSIKNNNKALALALALACKLTGKLLH